MDYEMGSIIEPSNDAVSRCIHAGSVRKNPPENRLSRSGMRLLAVVLEVFWAHLLNLQGKLTAKAKIMGADTLFGLDMSVAPQDDTSNGNFRAVCPSSSRNYDGAMNVNVMDMDLPDLVENNASLGYKFCMGPVVLEMRKSIMYSFFQGNGGQLDDAAVSTLLKKQYAPLEKEEYNSGALDGFDKPESYECTSKSCFSDAESKRLILHSLRVCIRKILSLEGSDWLFAQGGGYDEELIDLLASAERSRQRKGNRRTRWNLWINEDESAECWPFLPGCGDGCTWQNNLIASFGVWCIRRILELLLMEDCPELWGKFTRVLSRLQGVLDAAFLKPRDPVTLCGCLKSPWTTVEEFEQISACLHGLQYTSPGFILQMVNGVEAGAQRCKGRAGTAASGLAFRKGKGKASLVIKRCKRLRVLWR